MICPSCQSQNEDGADVCFHCRAVLVAVSRGTVIASRYEILEPLGKGGMGVVYKARDAVLEETVAIKLLRPDASEDEDLTRRFRSEIKLARRVSHKNVCRIHEYGEEHGRRFISMEYIDGADLKRVLRTRGGLPPGEAFEVALQVAQGLEAVHDEGIVHRDLKTTNIMRDTRGVIRLMDFGIAKRTGGDATAGGATATGQIVGTPEYMSPEQARGQRVDSRSDVYALGVVIFEIFTGAVPFRGDTPIATLFMHIEEPPPLEGPRAGNLPAALVPVLRRALAKDPSQRYQDAKEVTCALREASAAYSLTSPTAVAPPTVSMSGHEEPTGTVPMPTPTPMPAPQPTALAPTQAVAGPRTPTPIPPRPGRRPPVAERARTIPPRRMPRWPAGLAVGLLAAAGVGALWLATRGARPPDEPSAIAPSELVASPTPEAPSSTAGARMGSGAPVGSLATEPTPPPAGVTATLGVEGQAVEKVLPTPSLRAEPRRSSLTPTPRPTLTPPPTTLRQIQLNRLPPATPTPAPARFSTPTPAATPDVAPPVVVPTPQPTPAPRPTTPTPPPTTAPTEPQGYLQFMIVPFADVTVDDKSVGRIASDKISLSAGAHVVVLTHPDFEPVRRKVVLVAGETGRLVVDLAEEAIPKKKK